MNPRALDSKTEPLLDRITICYPVNYLGFGGAERQLVELVLGLDKARFHALVVTLYPAGPLEAELEGQEGVTLLSLNRAGRYDAVSVARLAMTLRSHRVQVVQPFLSPATLLGMCASVAARTPVRILTERCGLRRNRKLGNRLLRLAEDRLAGLADAVVANSQAGSEYVSGRGIPQDKIRVIYNGINPDRLKADAQRVAEIRTQLGDGPIVGTVASLTDAKDHATLIKAVGGLVSRFPDIRLALVGDGHRRGDLVELSSSLGLARNIVFFGHQRQVADYVAAFDVAALSSCDNEGCSNFLLEAMGMGKPVVATDVGGNRELVSSGENGYLVPIGDARGLSSAIERLLHDPQARTTMGRRGRQTITSRFSLSGMIESYQSLYWEQMRKKLGAPSKSEAAA